MKLLSKSCIDDIIGPLQSDTITTFFGPPGSGKSTITFLYVVSCLKEGKKVLFIDTEGGFSPERIKQLSPDVDLSNIIVFSPKTFEEQHKTIINLSKTLNEISDIGLVVLDSLVMLYRLKLGDSPQKINADLGEQLRFLTEISRTMDIPILVVNQMYTHFDTQEKRMVGGNLIEYWSKTIVLIDKDEKYRYALLRKHKFRKEGVKIFFNIEEEGIKVV